MPHPDDELPFTIIRPQGTPAPLLISIPHSGQDIPENYRAHYNSQLMDRLPDTDWHVDKLYKFATELGITIIQARYTRYLVDLNRPPDGSSLYSDGRKISGVVPSFTFEQELLFKDESALKLCQKTDHIQERIQKFFQPYHQAIADELRNLQKTYPHVLLFDAHSIRQNVPTISPEPFPDLILGDNLSHASAPSLSLFAQDTLQNAGTFSFQYNKPFSGGHITRSFGHPENKVHALQLEMSQTVYLEEHVPEIDSAKVKAIQPCLEKLLLGLCEQLKELK